jgi:hypothetical protein
MRRREKWKVGAFECEWHKSQARPHSTANCAAPACAPPRAPTPRRHCIDLQPRRGEEARPPPPTTLFNSRALGQFFSDDSCLPAVYITTPSSLTTLVCTLHPWLSHRNYWNLRNQKKNWAFAAHRYYFILETCQETWLLA